MRLFQKWIVAVSLGLVAFGAGASPSNPQSGVEYQTLSKPVTTDSGNKVEVLEFFSYACPHCNALDPSLSDWVKKQGDKIVFKRVPVSFGRSSWELLQKLYYSLESMGKLEELHPKVFRAIHVDRVQLDSDDAIVDFVVKQGIDKAKFLSVYNSFGVKTRMARGTQMIELFSIESVPTLVVGGRYVTGPAMAGASMGQQPESVLHAALMQVLDSLVKKAAPAETKAEAPAAPAAKPVAPAKPAKKK